jgi:hypothetical protein
VALFKFIGTEELIARGQTALLAEVRHALDELKDDAVAKTPEDTGALRGSYDVDGPHIAGTRVEGKVQAQEGYAVFVHERTHLEHPVGQAKFLQAALLENALRLRDRVAAAARRVY